MYCKCTECLQIFNQRTPRPTGANRMCAFEANGHMRHSGGGVELKVARMQPFSAVNSTIFPSRNLERSSNVTLQCDAILLAVKMLLTLKCLMSKEPPTPPCYLYVFKTYFSSIIIAV